MYLDTGDDRRLSSICRGDDQARDLLLSGKHRDGKDSTNRSELTVEGEFAHQKEVRHIPPVEKSDAAEDSDRERQVECGTFLLDVRRRQIHDDLLIGKR